VLTVSSPTLAIVSVEEASPVRGLRHEIEEHAAAENEDDGAQENAKAGFATVFCYSHTASSSSWWTNLDYRRCGRSAQAVGSK